MAITSVDQKALKGALVGIIALSAIPASGGLEFARPLPQRAQDRTVAKQTPVEAKDAAAPSAVVSTEEKKPQDQSEAAPPAPVSTDKTTQESAVETSATDLSEEADPVPPAAKTEAAAAPETPANDSTAANPAPEGNPSLATQPRDYEAVPASESEEYVERLKLAERLILQYGRAYDYRTHSVAELRKILEKLDSRGASILEKIRARNRSQASE